jgi:DNA repair exonuclease SbcCD ATPase subunit
MAEFESTERSQSGALTVAILAGLGLGIVSLVWAIALQIQLGKTQDQLAASQRETNAMQQRITASDARLRATSETFAQRLGTTQAQIDAKAQSILQRQNIENARREEAEQKISENVAAVKTDVGSVKSEVGGVKTDVTGVKTDVAATQADLASTKSQLQRTIGDAGVMSGLIARNSTELEELKHKGDRTYYEFSLEKNKDPKLMSSIKLQLKKVDAKKGKFTLAVNADDRVIEKKDKTLDEPIQFYSGKTPALFEIVVNNIGKNTVSGYLSVPKGQ